MPAYPVRIKPRLSGDRMRQWSGSDAAYLHNYADLHNYVVMNPLEADVDAQLYTFPSSYYISSDFFFQIRSLITICLVSEYIHQFN